MTETEPRGLQLVEAGRVSVCDLPPIDTWRVVVRGCCEAERQGQPHFGKVLFGELNLGIVYCGKMFVVLQVLQRSNFFLSSLFQAARGRRAKLPLLRKQAIRVLLQN